MSGSNRDNIAQIGLAASFAVALAAIALGAILYFQGYSSGRHDQRAHVERQHYAAETPKRIESECQQAASAARGECIAKIIDSERESQRSESDLAAQWKAADWVFWAAIIAGAQGLITLIGTMLLYEQIKLTRKAVTDTGQATEAMHEANSIARRSQRPWVEVKILPIEVYERDNKIALVLRVTLENSGQTVAEDVKIHIEQFCVTGYSINNYEQIIREPFPNIDFRSSYILPNSSIFQDHTLTCEYTADDEIVLEAIIRCEYITQLIPNHVCAFGKAWRVGGKTPNDRQSVAAIKTSAIRGRGQGGSILGLDAIPLCGGYAA